MLLFKGLIEKKTLAMREYVILLWFLCCLHCTAAVYHYQKHYNYPEPGPDITGSYCSRRPWGQQCCPDRDDYCTVPILDTVCYCDMFCNRTVADCCPDFWGKCAGIDPPEGALTAPPITTLENNCYHGGVLRTPGNEIHVNCNNCTCVFVPTRQEYNWKCTQKICLIRTELSDRVNTGNYGWHATNYSIFWGLSLAEGGRRRLGTFKPTDPVKSMTSLRVHVNDVLPERFDAREKWPGLIHQTADQGNCAASWAFSTASVAADRLSIHSNGHIREALSPQNLISCDRDYMQDGCEGGHLDRAWWYMRKAGIVTERCYPYTSGTTNKTGDCRLLSNYHNYGRKFPCPGQRGLSSRLFQSSPPYRIAPIEREIMKEIMDNGPVQATMEVKEDFFMYKGGVYRYSLPATFLPPNNHQTGYHSIRIIGWGVEQSHGRRLKYWLCANSWGRKWGEDGYFRILRGVNECQIESFILGVWGKVNGRPVINRPRTFSSSNTFRRNRYNRR